MSTNAPTADPSRRDMSRTICCGRERTVPSPCCASEAKSYRGFAANRRDAVRRLPPLSSGQVDPWVAR